MPLLVHCRELQPGMRLAQAFFFKNRMMLPGGKALSADDIDSLLRKFPDILLQVSDPLLDSLTTFDDDAPDRQVAASAQHTIAQAVQKVHERLTSRTSIANLDFAAIKSAAAAVMDFLKANPVTAALIYRSSDASDYLAEHAGAVFYLSMVLGSAVRDYVVRERMRQTAAVNLSPKIAMDLLPLGLGAMLMDVGMFPLKHLLDQTSTLTDQDRQAIRQHPVAGAEMLPDNLPPGVKTLVRAHHENFDGTGYPNGLKGTDLHIFPRIVRICDAFEAGTAQRVYSNAKSPARVIWEMSAGPYKRCYDPALMKVFRNLIQPFPIGAKLRLADGRYAVVVRYNHNNPFQPTVLIAFDENNERLERKQLVGPLNIGENNDLRLASFHGEDLSFLYDLAAEDSSLPTPETLQSLLDLGYP